MRHLSNISRRTALSAAGALIATAVARCTNKQQEVHIEPVKKFRPGYIYYRTGPEMRLCRPFELRPNDDAELFVQQLRRRGCYRYQGIDWWPWKAIVWPVKAPGTLGAYVDLIHMPHKPGQFIVDIYTGEHEAEWD